VAFHSFGENAQLLIRKQAPVPNVVPRIPEFYVLTSQSQSHIATDGQSVSKSWCRAPSGAHGQILITL
jgi:hypothetical protein